MAIAKPGLTEEQFMRLPDDGRKYELVDGEAKEVPAGIRHDIIGITIASMLRPFVKGRGSIAGSQAGFRMRSSNIRSPDVSFTRKERFPGGVPPEGFADFAPDLCIDIISPSEDRDDMERKRRDYFAAGARQVWHLFPQAQRVLVYTSPAASVAYEADDDVDAGDLLRGFRCRAAELFALE